MPAIVTGVRKRNTRLVIKFDEYDRTVDAIVERADRVELSNPCKNGAIKISASFVQSSFRMAGRKPVRI